MIAFEGFNCNKDVKLIKCIKPINMTYYLLVLLIKMYTFEMMIRVVILKIN